MKTEKIANRCQKCQAPLPPDAEEGLCAECAPAAAAMPKEAVQPTNHGSAQLALPAVSAAFPQLEIIQSIGHGGMGVVYKARQPKLGRFVALKILPQSLAADATFAERFNREARVLALFSHPSIVTLYDFGQSGGFFYLLMEFVDGGNLRQAMRAARFTPQQALQVVPQICDALEFAHNEGVLHRDIKPENILLDKRGRVKIADFGIAKLVGEARENLTLTASGMVVGTPNYMAPEQLEHPQDVDQRADIYSLGVVFYEMLTGELPIGHFALPSEKSAVDPRADAVVLRALEQEREKRYRSAAEVKTSIEAITAGPAAPAASAAGGKPERPLWWTVSAWAFVAIGLLAVIDILGGFYSRPMSPTLSPAVAHLFAGIALLTANRRWRLVALAALGVAVLLAAFIAIVIAISPEHATLTLPVSNLTIRASEKPRWVATTVVLLAIVFGWPCYLLMCAKAKALFGITKPN